MKRVYLVRHGETIANLEGILQGQSIDSELSEKGITQAELVARRAQDLSFECILTSDLKRAHQTAEIISKRTHVPIAKACTELREFKFPSEFEGGSTTDPKRLAYRAEQKTVTDPSWRHSDEETFADIYARAQAAERLFLDRPETELLVVTHGDFIKFLIGYFICGELLTPTVWSSVNYSFGISNTGITIAEEGTSNDTAWKLVTVNDYAHLAEAD